MRYTGQTIYYNGSYRQNRDELLVNMIGRNVYELVRIINGHILFWDDHNRRLQNSLRAFGIKELIQSDDLQGIIKKLFELNKLDNVNVRIDYFISDELSLCIGFIPGIYPDLTMYQNGVKTQTMMAERENPEVKVLHEELKSRALKRIEQEKLYDVLLVDAMHCITEGSKTNVFFIKDKTVFTPNTSRVLPGVTRGKIMALCKQNNILIKETDIPIKTISNYEAVFLTGTSPKVLPVNKIDNVIFSTDNSTLNFLMTEYNHLISRSLY